MHLSLHICIISCILSYKANPRYLAQHVPHTHALSYCCSLLSFLLLLSFIFLVSLNSLNSCFLFSHRLNCNTTLHILLLLKHCIWCLMHFVEYVCRSRLSRLETEWHQPFQLPVGSVSTASTPSPAGVRRAAGLAGLWTDRALKAAR